MCLFFCSVAQSCPTLCDPMVCSMPGFPVLHHLPELAQTHIHWVNDAIQPSHPVIPFSSLQSFAASGSFPVSRLFASGGQSIGASASALVLPMNIQGWLPLGLTGLISLLSEQLSRVFCLFPCELKPLTGVHFCMCINKKSLLDQILNRPPEPSFRPHPWAYNHF